MADICPYIAHRDLRLVIQARDVVVHVGLVLEYHAAATMSLCGCECLGVDDLREVGEVAVIRGIARVPLRRLG